MTGEEAKRKLREQGITLKEWADARGYPYYLVSRVICGIDQRQFWPFTQSRGRSGHETGIERTFANSMINVLPGKTAIEYAPPLPCHS